MLGRFIVFRTKISDALLKAPIVNLRQQTNKSETTSVKMIVLLHPNSCFTD